MLVLEIELLAGRYHATPWGRAANEGQPEWPPAPWRLGRALASAWWRLDPTQRPAEATVDALLARLAPPPRFLVPRATLAHTRHYMPTGALKDGMNQTTLVLDAFARVAPGRLAVIWDGIELADDERDALDRLCDVIGYIGRAESPCVIRRVAAASLEVEGRFAVGLYDTDGAAEPVGLLCLTEAPHLAALSESTGQRRKRRITTPADGRRLTYGLPPGATDAPRVRHEPNRHAATTALRFVLDGPALPPITEALRMFVPSAGPN